MSSCKPCVSSLVNLRQRLITETAIFISSWRKSLYLTQVAQEAGVHPDFLSMKRPEVCNNYFSPLDGMLVNLKVTSFSPPKHFTRLPWQETQQNNPARSRTQTSRPGVQHTDLKATAYINLIGNGPRLVIAGKSWLLAILKCKLFTIDDNHLSL